VARPGTGAAVQELSAEEVGYVELVAATINTMLTGASPTDDGHAHASTC
jgi:Mn-containing catalase